VGAWGGGFLSWFARGGWRFGVCGGWSVVRGRVSGVSLSVGGVARGGVGAVLSRSRESFGGGGLLGRVRCTPRVVGCFLFAVGGGVGRPLGGGFGSGFLPWAGPGCACLGRGAEARGCCLCGGVSVGVGGGRGGVSFFVLGRCWVGACCVWLLVWLGVVMAGGASSLLDCVRGCWLLGVVEGSYPSPPSLFPANLPPP